MRRDGSINENEKETQFCQTANFLELSRLNFGMLQQNVNGFVIAKVQIGFCRGSWFVIAQRIFKYVE